MRVNIYRESVYTNRLFRPCLEATTALDELILYKPFPDLLQLRKCLQIWYAELIRLVEYEIKFQRICFIP